MDLNEKNERINNNGEAEQQGEDEKMEKFFALIRSFRDARDRRRNELKELEIMRKKNKNEMKTKIEMMKKKKKRTKAEHEEHQSSWVPSFEWEDFSEDHQHHHHLQFEFRKPTLIFPGPCIKKNHERAQNDQKDEETGLDLKLAL